MREFSLLEYTAVGVGDRQASSPLRRPTITQRISSCNSIMRLINTQTLALEQFYGEIPPYAILSHRWEAEEVTLQDFAAQVYLISKWGLPMKGFKKIRYCIDQAKREGIGYCWVDTCCIDKSSSAELTEAINSMYAWYRNSAVCYIYMADVHPAAVSETQQAFGARFRSSLWFTRGWTLQELLAPRKKVFYNAKWAKILEIQKSAAGDVFRDIYLPHVVKEVTGISEEAMRDFSPTSRDYSVARKMSWASNRKTTRSEDTAYCLMGIFDINMPLLYGEGPKAFMRLQEEIMKKTHDHSIFCWRDSTATDFTFRGLLARTPAEFSESYNIQPSPNKLIRPGEDISPLIWTGENGSNLKKVYGMTNQGLQITLPLYLGLNGMDAEVNNSEFYARLDCIYIGNGGAHRPCSLLLTYLGNGKWARVNVGRHPKYEVVPAGLGLPIPTEVFVHENIEVHEAYSSPRIRGVLFESQAIIPPEQFPQIVHVDSKGIWTGRGDMSITFGEKPLDVASMTPNDFHIATVTFESRFGVGFVYFTVCLEWMIDIFGRARHLALKARFVDTEPRFSPSFEVSKKKGEQVACLQLPGVDHNARLFKVQYVSLVEEAVVYKDEVYHRTTFVISSN